MMRRQSGVVVPLFSLVSNQGWGIGEFGDLPMFARWLMEAGQSLVQILPIHEMPPIETSPYSAMTAMALDPIYIRMSMSRTFGIGTETAPNRAGGDQAAAAIAAHRLLVDSMAQRSLAATLVRALPAARGVEGHAARGAIRRLCHCASVVAGRVRVVSRHQRVA